MDAEHLAMLFRLLPSGTIFEPGLSDAEIVGIEATHGFQFPPDLRAFLQHALPVGDRWVDWRHASHEHIRKRLDWPVEGLCGDVPHSLWLKAWGPQPEDAEEAVRIARRHASMAPRMIPVYSHRYLPAEPSLPGNPVFSIMQSDIIHYGYDLADYFDREFRSASGHERLPDGVAKHPRPIRFWDLIVFRASDA